VVDCSVAVVVVDDGWVGGCRDDGGREAKSEVSRTWGQTELVCKPGLGCTRLDHSSGSCPQLDQGKGTWWNVLEGMVTRVCGNQIVRVILSAPHVHYGAWILYLSKTVYPF
jgi:hypothetical protein